MTKEMISIFCDLSIYMYKCSNIPTAPSYGAYIPQLLRYSRAFRFYHYFIDIWSLLTRKILNQAFLVDITLRTLDGHHNDLVNPILSSFRTYHWVCNQYNTICAGTGYSFGAHQFIHGFQWDSWQIFSFLCNAFQIVACHFVLFLSVIILPVFLQFTDSGYPFGILKVFLSYRCIGLVVATLIMTYQ